MNLALLPEGVTLEQAVMATDMMTTGFYGSELADVQLGDTVVVFGIGPVGLMAVAGAQISGAAQIIAIGTRPNCVELAKEYGATDVLSYKDGDLVKQIKDVTNGRGCDVAIVAGGGAEALNNALGSIRAGQGRVSMLEVITETKELVIPNAYVGGFLFHKSINGGLCPGGRRRLERLLSLIKYNRVDPGKMITHRFEGFDSIEEAFHLMVDKPKDLIKPIVIIND